MYSTHKSVGWSASALAVKQEQQLTRDQRLQASSWYISRNKLRVTITVQDVNGCFSEVTPQHHDYWNESGRHWSCWQSIQSTASTGLIYDLEITGCIHRKALSNKQELPDDITPSCGRYLDCATHSCQWRPFSLKEEIESPKKKIFLDEPSKTPTTTRHGESSVSAAAISPAGNTTVSG